ncbi:MAG: DSD1 family PLP-dependent enzyme [Chloroflexi bacterium]|nr:DSD1 family PLP-dependent enzyme [Chloroflexota bacterium]
MPRSLIGTPKADLDTPALCLDIEAVEANIRRMANALRDSPVRLRPHAKTHKSPILAQMQLAAGAIGITCAKLGEAEVLAAAGIKDILIANQIIGTGKIARLVNLAAYTDVMVAVDDAANVAELDAASQAKGVRLRVLIEVDIGMARCGVFPGEPTLALAQRVVASPGLRFEGVMGYEGHTIFLKDPEERRQKTEASVKLLVDTADLLRRRCIPVPIVSSGGTGTYFITGRYPGVTEIQAGSYITMDGQYREEVGIDFAYGLTVLATVVSARDPDRAEIDAGLKTLTRDFGLPKVIDPPGWELVGLSEEHGHLRRAGGAPLKPGDKVEIVPNHGCTTINLHDEYHVIRRGMLEAVWPIAARGKIG